MDVDLTGRSFKRLKLNDLRKCTAKKTKMDGLGKWTVLKLNYGRSIWGKLSSLRETNWTVMKVEPFRLSIVLVPITHIRATVPFKDRLI